MIGHKYVPSREGGVEIVVEELATRMASLGHDVTLFNRKRKEYERTNAYKGCKIKEIFTVNKKSLDAIVYAYFATRRAKKLIKRGLVDVVHFHAEGPCFFLNLLPKPEKRKGCKIVVTIHGLDWQRGKWGSFASKILKKCEKKAVKYADEIIVLSKNNVDYFKKTYKRSTTFIPNGVGKPLFHSPEIIKQKYGLDKNQYVLFLARIVPEKGLHYLIDAWNKLCEKKKIDKKLVIAGGASHSDDYYQGIMKCIKGIKSIIATGFVQGQELQELYSNAFLYVLPSDVEGMPMSLLEALSYGRTCLVSNIPENLEVIDNTCYSFKKGDVDDLTTKLEIILGAEQKKVESDRERIFVWDDIVEKTINLYKQ